MAKLTDEQKVFVVMSFARYAQPQEIMRAMVDVWGIEGLSWQQLDNYNPESAKLRVNPNRFAKWRKLYDDTRAEMLSNLNEIKIVNPAYRLHVLDKLVDRALAKNNSQMAASLLEQAAKECGGAYTNKREVAGKLQHTHHAEEPATEYEKKAILADKLRDALTVMDQTTTRG